MPTRRLLVALTIILLPGPLLAPLWRQAGPAAGAEDLLYYYPSRAFLHEALAAGHWPWLNPWTGLDRPYAAEPQSALWYPPTWLFAVLPPVWAYSISLWLHFVIAAWGMYRLTRANGLDQRAALFAGLAFAFSGFMLAHHVHLTLLAAGAWTPWLFYRMHRYAAMQDDTGRGLGRLSAAGVVCALPCLAGGVQIAALCAAGQLVFLLPGRKRAPTPPRLATVLSRWLLVWICAAALCAVQWLPTLAYLPLCAPLDENAATGGSAWRLGALVGWLLPEFSSERALDSYVQPHWGPSPQCEQFAYAGLAALLLAALAVRGPWRWDPLRRRWVALLTFSLLLMLGMLGPLDRLFSWLPGGTWWRFPARTMLLFNLATAALAASVLHDLAAPHTPTRVRLRALLQRWTRRPVRAAILLVAIPLALFAATLPLLDAEARSVLLAALRPWKLPVLAPLLTAMVTFAALATVARRWQQPARLWLLAIVAAADLGFVGWTQTATQEAPTSADLTELHGQPWLEAVHASGQRLWVVTDAPGVYLHPLQKRVANTNTLVHISALSDFGPRQPRVLAERFGFTPWGDTPRATELLRQSDWLRAYNVGWVLLCGPEWPAPTGCDLVHTTPQGWRLFHNPSAAGPALFDDPTQPGALRCEQHSPHEFTTIADTWAPTAVDDRSSPPRLVVARLALPGWTATAGGRPVPIETAHGALMAISLPPGETVCIHWTYFPPGLREGAAVSGLSAAALAGFSLRSHLRRRHRPTRRAGSAAALAGLVILPFLWGCGFVGRESPLSTLIAEARQQQAAILAATPPLSDQPDAALHDLLAWHELPHLRSERHLHFSSHNRAPGTFLIEPGGKDFNNFISRSGSPRSLLLQGLDQADAHDPPLHGYVLTAVDDGPGYVSRMFFTRFVALDLFNQIDFRPFQDEIIRIYVDDLLTPAFVGPLADLGTAAPFGPSLAGITSGALLSYTPISFNERVRIVLDGLSPLGGYFYGIDVRLLERGTRSFSSRLHEDPAYAAACALLAAGVPPAGEALAAWPTDVSFELLPGRQTTIFTDGAAGTIRQLRFEFDAIDQSQLSALHLGITYDAAAEPAVDVPLDALFACRERLAGWQTLPLQVSYDAPRLTATLHLPMPFAQGVQVAVRNDGAAPVAVRANVLIERVLPPEPWGYLHARCFAVSGPQPPGSRFEVLNVNGRGRYVGTLLSAAGRPDPHELLSHPLNILEGNSLALIDGQPGLRGTGTEDYYNAGFYFSAGPFNHPFAAANHVADNRHDQRGVVSCCRWHVLSDALDFQQSFALRFQYAADSPAVVERYATVACYYLDRPAPGVVTGGNRRDTD
jgi:hypothetical protein